MVAYVVDADFFTQAHHMDYPLSNRSVFWSLVEQLSSQQTLVSVDRVKRALLRDDPVIARWCAAHLPKDFFRGTGTLIQEYRVVARWAIERRDAYVAGAIHDFLSVDEPAPWAMLYALQHQRSVVTYEQNLSDRNDKIHIGDVCKAFGVPCVNPAQMFASLGIRL